MNLVPWILIYASTMVLLSFRHLDPGLNHTEGEGTDKFQCACASQSRTSDVLVYPSTLSFRNKICQRTWSFAGDQNPQWFSYVFPPPGCHRHRSYPDFYWGIENANLASHSFPHWAISSVPNHFFKGVRKEVDCLHGMWRSGGVWSSELQIKPILRILVINYKMTGHVYLKRNKYVLKKYEYIQYMKILSILKHKAKGMMAVYTQLKKG